MMHLCLTSVIHFLTKTLPPSENTFLVLSETRSPPDLVGDAHRAIQVERVSRKTSRAVSSADPQGLQRQEHQEEDRQQQPAWPPDRDWQGGMYENIYKCKYKCKYLTKIGKVECVLRVASSQVPPDPIHQLVDLFHVISFLKLIFVYLCFC